MSTRAQIPKPIAAPMRLVTPAPFGTLQRKCACGGSGGSGGECEGCKKKKLQRSAAGQGPDAAPPIVHDVLHSPGQPLDAPTMAFFEPRFGHDFSKVRIHADSQAAESSRSMNAAAYTVGSNIVFGSGQYSPSRPTGKRLLAHELTHVIQQPVTPSRAQLSLGAVADVYEREAERASLTLPLVSEDNPLSRQTGFADSSPAPAKATVAAGTIQRQMITPLAPGGGFGGLMDRDRNAPVTDRRQIARDSVVRALKLINPSQDESANIVPYDQNNAQVNDPSKIDTSNWSSGFSLHAKASQKDVPGFAGLQVKIYPNDAERQNFTTIGLEHSGLSHVYDYIFNYSPIEHDPGNHTNADIAAAFCAKVKGGCP